MGRNDFNRTFYVPQTIRAVIRGHLTRRVEEDLPVEIEEIGEGVADRNSQ
jgi:hypothetical protein